ncbi:NADP-dependent oxidoreductase [Oceanicoccus sp. KOV_DT_Chl]|uniref:NADP-dependent oxidoreductase n=1 Tax=Oceanicoccus sp. KOV_DT_Chl TaxID=1904639 RepID=UPI000C7C01A6|nr:NADP-dependent oxidoreductase [Oceanicoccus sp. KOV_DT_Chl]
MNKPAENKQWLLKQFVQADEVLGEQHYEMVSSPMPTIGDQQILVQTLLLGTSPAQRMYVTEQRTFHIAVEIGEVMSGRGVGLVLESKHPDFKSGDIIQATLGWQQYVALTPDDKTDTGKNVRTVQKVDQPVRPLTTIMGLFGQLAFSAYVGIIEIGQVKPGDVVLISSAAGGVGSVACQLARIQGAAKVVGIAGGKEKCQWLLEQGLCDAAIDYKSEDLVTAIASHCPDGADVYLDNVGGDMLDAALQNIAVGARVVICGMISTEYLNPRPDGPKHYFNLLYKRSRMEGFFVFDYVPRWPEFEIKLRQWYSEGKLKLVDDVFEGLESAPIALGSLFTGGHTGGCVIRVAEDPLEIPSL